MKLRHILLTTDLSEHALRPFAPVLELAMSMGARVTVLYVVEDVPVAPHGAPLAPPLTAPDLSRTVEEARKALVEHCASLETEVALELEVVTHASAAKGIVQYARENDVDLVAISSHGRTGMRRLALGSVAEAVLRHSPIPVLSFHRPEEPS